MLDQPHRHKRKLYRNYLLVFLLIANSGLPFFTNEPFILLGSLVFTYFFVSIRELNNKFFITTLIFLVVLLLGQYVTTEIFSLRTSLTLFVRWVYPFLVLLVVKDEFAKIYTNVIYFLTVVSLILFIPSMLIPGFENALTNISGFFEQSARTDFYEYNANILIYTIKPSYAMDGSLLFKRNSGPFWEAGAFGSYLVLAIIFNLLYEQKLFNRKNIVFFVALLTTWSTASMIALMLVLALYGIWMFKKKLAALLIVPIVIYGAIYAYDELPFLAERIDRTAVYFQQRDQIGYERRDRMVSAIVDIRTFAEYPLFGTGRDKEARFGLQGARTYLEHRNNGVTDFLVKYGVFFFLFYFYNVFLGFKKLSFKMGGHDPTRFGILALIGILTIGFSQGLFQQSVFIALFYQHLLLESRTQNLKQSRNGQLQKNMLRNSNF